jgi:hypothetical protein
MSASHHLPTVTMVHPLKQLLSPVLAAMVTDDQRRQYCEDE